MVLGRLEKRPEIETALNASFERLLTRYREVQSVMPELAPKPRPKRDYRRASKEARQVRTVQKLRPAQKVRRTPMFPDTIP